MKKIITASVIIILLILFMVNHYKPIQVNDLMTFQSNDILPEKIEASIYFSPSSDKDLRVVGQNSIKEIVEVVGNIKIRKTLILPESYSPKLKETYRLTLDSQNNGVDNIHIFNNNYIEVNGTTYKILKSQNLTSIYNTIILDQPKDIELDEFYYDLIEINE